LGKSTVVLREKLKFWGEGDIRKKQAFFLLESECRKPATRTITGLGGKKVIQAIKK